eukprot:5010839-Pyramimonas_sp.AAC.1
MQEEHWAGRQEGGACSRGPTFPNESWRRGPSPNSRGDKWQFRRKVDRSQLARAQESHPEDVLLKACVDKLKRTFGAECDGWPEIGRGCKFLSFESGPPMVAGLKVGNAREAFAAERLPRQLDCAIKECRD